MITLSKKLKGPEERRPSGNDHAAPSRRISIRDKLLVKEVQELEANLPSSCSIRFENPDELWHLELSICPEEGFWQGGRFFFDIHVSQEYNMVPPMVKCQTKLWHPNISEDGDVCLSLLRQNSIDGLGWSPTRTLKDVVWGLNSLFTDLLNFDDPLNIEAAEHYQKDREGFRVKVREYVQCYAKR